MRCREICRRQSGLTKPGPKTYKDGRKYCSRCEWAFIWEGLYCPCCGIRMRTSGVSNTAHIRRQRRKVE